MMHSPEPWSPSNRDTGMSSTVYRTILGSDDELVASIYTSDEQEGNLERIVACVNFCRGVSTEDLVNALDPNVSINVICQIVGKLRTRGTPDGITQP